MSAAWRRHASSVLMIALAAGAAVAVVVTKSHVTSTEKDTRADNVLGAFRSDDISRLVITRSGSTTKIERGAADDAGNRDWLLTEPVREAADEFAVDKLLRSLEFARALRRLPEGQDRDQLGLTQPSWTIDLVMGAVEFHLALGKESVDPAGSYYLEVTGKGAPKPGVVIVSKELVAELGVSADALRERGLMPYVSLALAKITLGGKGGTRKLRKDPGEIWRFDGQDGDAVLDRAAWNRTLAEFQHLDVDTFLDAQAADALVPDADAVTLDLVPEDPSRPSARLRVGGKCPGGKPGVVAVRIEPDRAAGCVADTVLGPLSTPAAELAQREAFWLHRDEVETLEIEIGGHKLALDRSQTGFVLRAPQKGEVELDAGNARIDTLVKTRGEVVISPDLAALGLDPPAGSVVARSVAKDDKDVIVDRVLVGKVQSDGTLAVRRERDGVVLRMARDAARAFRADSTLVRSRTLLTIDEKQVTDLKLRFDGARQALKFESGAWRLVEPRGYQHDAGVLSDALDALCKLTAERWVSDTDDPAFGLAAPRAVAELSYTEGDAGARQVTLEIGAETEGGWFARLAGTPGVFVVSRGTLRAVTTWTLDRAATQLELDHARKVEIQAGEKRLTLERKADGADLVVTSGSAAPDAVRKIVGALGLMRAESALHLGAAIAAEGLDHPVLVVKVETFSGARSTLRVGAGDAWRELGVHYARIEGVDATYVVLRSRIRDLLDAL